jgi:hypothetical protein
MNGKLFLLLVLSPALLPVVVEVMLIHWRPWWFAWLAYGSLGEHTFTVSATKPDKLPALPAVIELSQLRLISRGSLVMVQRRLTNQNTRSPGPTLVRIDVHREGDTITLRARRTLVPLSLGLAAVIFCAMCATNTANLIGALVLVVLVSVAVGVTMLLNADPQPCKKAFRRLEREYRRLLEEPIREASEVR